MPTNSLMTLHFTSMSKPQLYKAGRMIILEFNTEQEAEKFTLDEDGKIQKINKLKIAKKIFRDRSEDLQKQLKDAKKELKESEDKIRYLENKVSQLAVENGFLKGEEPPAKEEDQEINFEDAEFEEEDF